MNFLKSGKPAAIIDKLQGNYANENATHVRRERSKALLSLAHAALLSSEKLRGIPTLLQGFMPTLLQEVLVIVAIIVKQGNEVFPLWLL